MLLPLNKEQLSYKLVEVLGPTHTPKEIERIIMIALRLEDEDDRYRAPMYYQRKKQALDKNKKRI